MNTAIRNLGFFAQSTQNHNAKTAGKPLQSKPDVLVRNQDRLSFGGWFGSGNKESIKRVIKSIDDFVDNVRITATRKDAKSGELLETSLEASIDFVKNALGQREVKSRVTKILTDNKRPDGRAAAIADMLNYYTNAGIMV